MRGPDINSAVTTSIIVASYQRPQLLIRCLDSVLAQAHPPTEVVVALKSFDHASQKVLANYQQQHPIPAMRAALVEMLSIKDAENAAVASARGDIICFIDDDAVAHPDWLERIVGHYEDPTVGGVGGRDIIYEDGRMVNEKADIVGKITWYGAVIGNHHKFIRGVCEVDVLKGCNMSFRRQLISKIDERLRGEITYRYEEDLCFQVKKQGYRLIYDPAILVDHHVVRSTAVRRNQDCTPHILASSHNYVYLGLKHFAQPKKLIFLLYTFLVGDSGAPGLLHLLYRGFKSGEWKTRWHSYRVSQRSKFQGITTYMASLFRKANAS